jgi:hypothetical protein
MALTLQEAALAKQHLFRFSKTEFWHRSKTVASKLDPNHTIWVGSGAAVKASVVKLKRYPELATLPYNIPPHTAIALHRGVFTVEAFEQALDDLLDALFGEELRQFAEAQGYSVPHYSMYRRLLSSYESKHVFQCLLHQYTIKLQNQAAVPPTQPTWLQGYDPEETD